LLGLAMSYASIAAMPGLSGQPRIGGALALREVRRSDPRVFRHGHHPFFMIHNAASSS
jgi:hypothetical protein